MKRLAICALVLIIGLAFTTNVNAQEKAKKAAKGKVIDSKPVNSVCPVTGEEIEKGAPTVTYEGKTYALCCKSCIKKFNKEPAKYIGNLSEDGKKFVKQKTK